MAGYTVSILRWFLMAGALALFILGCFGAQHCGPGHYFNAGADGAEGECKPCERGFYMEEEKHTNKECKQCSIFDKTANRNEEQTDECTIYHDTQWRCFEGFFMKLDKNCYPCEQCGLKGKFEVQACTQLSNTVCCDSQEMTAVDGKCVTPTQHTVVTEESTPSTSQTCEPCPKVSYEVGTCERGEKMESQESCKVCMTDEAAVFATALGIVLAFFAGIIVASVWNRI